MRNAEQNFFPRLESEYIIHQKQNSCFGQSSSIKQQTIFFCCCSKPMNNACLPFPSHLLPDGFFFFCNSYNRYVYRYTNLYSMLEVNLVFSRFTQTSPNIPLLDGVVQLQHKHKHNFIVTLLFIY